MIRRLLPLLVLAVSLSAQPQVDTSRPLFDARDVVGIVPQGATIDIYWLHTNEFANPVQSTLLRTIVSADGLTRIATHVVRQFETSVVASVSGEGSNVQLIWRGYDEIQASPIVNGVLKYPEGKPITYGDFPGIRCTATDCVVLFGTYPIYAAILDTDSNVVSGPFAMPAGTYPISVTFDERGIFFARNTLTELRAALVRRDGSVAYDVRIGAADPAAFRAAFPAAVSRGTDHVVAFVDFAPEPDEILAVTISPDGAVSAPVHLMQVEPNYSPNNVGVLSLSWSGSRFLLGGAYVIGGSFLLPLTADFRPAGELSRNPGVPAARPHPDGSSFILAWPTPRPYLTILKQDGSMTPPLDIVPPASRRRAVR